MPDNTVNQNLFIADILQKITQIKAEPSTINKISPSGPGHPMPIVQFGEQQEWKEIGGATGVSIHAAPEGPSQNLNSVLVGSAKTPGYVLVGDGKGDVQSTSVLAKPGNVIALNGYETRIDIQLANSIRAFFGFSKVVQDTFGVGEDAGATLAFLDESGKPIAAYSQFFAFVSSVIASHIWTESLQLGPNESSTPTINVNGGTGAVQLRHIDVMTAAGAASVTINGDSGDLVLANADVAEEFDISPGQAADPGMVMILNSDGSLRPCNTEYDTRVIGVISGAGSHKPGLVLDRKNQVGRKPVALMGKVFCFADAGPAPIKAGDILTTAARLGHAQKLVNKQAATGTVVGKALASLEQGAGLIPVLVCNR